MAITMPRLYIIGFGANYPLALVVKLAAAMFNSTVTNG